MFQVSFSFVSGFSVFLWFFHVFSKFSEFCFRLFFEVFVYKSYVLSCSFGGPSGFFFGLFGFACIFDALCSTMIQGISWACLVKIS